MAERAPKTIAELSRVLGINARTSREIAEYLNSISLQQFEEIIKRVNSLFKAEEDRLKTLEKINSIYVNYAKLIGNNKIEESAIYQILEDQREVLSDSLAINKKINDAAHKYADILKRAAGPALDYVLKQNQEIFKVAHEMQLESNLTWKQYSEVYDRAFEATRNLNKEVGQSIANAKDIIQTQNTLLQAGFRGLDATTLTNISSSAYMMAQTLGKFPEELAVAFRQSYRLFGDQTNQFVTNLGNRLNAFSNTFGVSLGMLTGVVSEMMASNSFIFRNNMQAQTAANENLIRAAALSGAIGLTSTNFLSGLAQTAQFGTIEEMSSIYQGGALLQGFDTGSFQQMMQGGQYQGATEMLFSSISQTLGGIEDQYLRAEYMQRIGSSFGLSREELLLITQNAANLGEYTEMLEGKVRDLDTSMVDELSELRMSLSDRLENLFSSGTAAQNLGKVLQDTGLVGTAGYLKAITGMLTLITGKQLGLGNVAGSLASRFIGGGALPINVSSALPGGTAGTGGVSAMGGLGTAGRLGIGAGGLAVGVGSNVLGSAIQSNTNLSNAGANIGGGALNVLGGAAGGALTGFAVGGPIGAAVGAGIGAIAGGINTYLGAKERESAMQQLEDERRASARQARTVATGDPVVDAINSMNANLTNVLNDNFGEQIRWSFIADTQNKTSTLGD